MRQGRKDNVVSGGFGKRRTVREPDRRSPQPKVLNTNWLDPDAYDALSPKEKRELWAKRQIERKHEKRRHGSGKVEHRSSCRNWMLGPAWTGVLGVDNWRQPVRLKHFER